MKVELPKNNVSAGMSYESATLASTHSTMQRSASLYSVGGDIQYTLPRLWDPASYGMVGNQQNTGFDLLRFDDDPMVRQQVLLGLRNIAKTHAVSHACIEVYSRYPVQGLKLQHNNAEVERFFTELFLEDLDFENFLTDLGRSFWIDGTAFVYGNWSDELGLWVGEDLLDPLTMDIRRVPFASEDLVYMIPSDDLKSLARGQSTEGRMFRQKFPDMAEAIATGKDILMSSDRVTLIANKDRPSDLWGTPVMLRSWNTLRLEDRMNSAMSATADRLYAPLIMFTVGGQLPDGTQYIPSAGALEAFRSNLDAALSSDFRAIVTHQGVQSQEVIRGDRMNNFKQDIDMYDERIFMAWGLTSSILKPNSGTYATSALEFQLASQMLSSYQKVLMKVYTKQAALVAESQKIYEYEKKGDSLQVVKELREVWDEDANDGEGAFVVKELPKLAVPRMVFDSVNFKDEQKEREFRQALKKEGMPIADNDIAIGVDIDLDASAEKYISEVKKKKLDEARMNKEIYIAAVLQDLPVPPDVKTYMEAAIPPEELSRLVEEYRDKQVSTPPELDTELGDAGELGVSSFDGDIEGPSARPEESDEQRADMPKP